jgi:hypothetical protein
MKYLFVLLPLFSCAQKQIDWHKLYNGNSMATYSLMFAGGFSDGLNDCVVANKFHDDKFWGLDAWRNKGYESHFRATYLTFTCDGWHLTKFTSPVFYSTAVAINLGEKQNWKFYVVKGLVCLSASRLGHEVCYNLIFKNYPK